MVVPRGTETPPESRYEISGDCHSMVQFCPGGPIKCFLHTGTKDGGAAYTLMGHARSEWHAREFLRLGKEGVRYCPPLDPAGSEA